MRRRARLPTWRRRLPKPHQDPFDSGEWWDPDGFLFGLHELLNPVRVPFIADHLHRGQASTVLDVGCGGGFLAEALAGEGFTLTGVDHSEAAIAAAVHSAFSSTRYVIGDAHDLPFDSGEFDAVVLSETLEHLDRPGVAFAEAARVLSPGGVLIVTGPNRTILSRLVLIWLAQEWPTRVLPRGLHKHRSFLTPHQLAGWCEESGLLPTTMQGLGISSHAIGRSVLAVAKLRAGRISYPEAARAIKLSTNNTPVIAFMAAATKRQ